MATSGNIRAGGAFVELGLRAKGLYDGLKMAGAKLKGFSGTVNSLGSSIGGALSTGLGLVTSAAKTAGLAVAGITAGLAGAIAAFLATDKRLLTPEQQAAAEALRTSLAGLAQSAQKVVAALMTELQPAISTIIDIVRLGMQAFQNWIATQHELIASVTEFLKGIKNALAAGDIALAANILWAGIKVAFKSGIAALMEPWTEWKTSFQTTAAEAFLGVMKIAGDAWRSLRQGAYATGDFISDAFASWTNAVAQRLINLQENLGTITEEQAAVMRESLGELQDAEEDNRQKARRERDRVIEQERQQSDRDFGETVVDARKAIFDANQRQLESSKRDVATAKAELDALVRKANGLPPLQNLQPDAVQDLSEEKIAKIAAEKFGVTGTFSSEEKIAKIAAEKFGVTGTFSASAVRGIGASSPLKKTEDNTKATADAAKKTASLLQEIVDNGGLAFA